ncbi:ABC transporter substrate-binding protein [Bifidobacterium avesanii]|uniref:ABC transporter substrate-binding protein n=1 Tax=Bifidobacterium avesanii TaxID=1798157 RepID=A0A7K3TGT4_9BIFI|nr:ABC transporter substrate-binding protein [Bifidobacterium avesanii]KAB8291459.1 ABC transporter substrate-binding protein [Bifidobacterium avesanii]NEG77909.1 ABC transporter substrate-binding protein [Bifidobacterium avesanii]
MPTHSSSSFRSRRPLSVTLSAAGLAAVLVLSGCGSANAASRSSAAGGTPVSGGTLKVAEIPDIYSCIDPSQASWSGSRNIVRQFVESLTDQDPETNEIKPWLASDWTISPDGKTYTFNLKHGITFSNGEAFNADAVVKNIQSAAATPGVPASTALTTLDQVRAVDDDTVEISFKEPNPSFLSATSITKLGMLAPESLKQTPEQRCTGSKLYGTAAFTLESYDPKTKAVLRKRADYKANSALAKHDGPAYLDAIEYQYIPEESVRTGSLVSGQVDAIVAPSDQQITDNAATQIKAAGGTVESRALPGQAFNLYPNVREGRILSDVRVRQAVSLAIDRATYASTAIRKDYTVVKGFYGATTSDAIATPELTKYDPQAAGKLLDEAGWTLGPDGYRYKDGRKLTLHWLDKTKKTGVELVIDELKQIGVDLQFDQTTAAVAKSRDQSGDYDLNSIASYTRNDPSALNLYYSDQASYKTGEFSLDEANWTKAQDLYRAGGQESDEAKRAEDYKQFQQLLADQYAVFPLYERSQDYAHSAKLQGARFIGESWVDFYDAWLAK